MMGLSGHLDGIPGLSRAAQLHLLGNTVVPAQASRALELLGVRWQEGRVGTWRGCGR
ncbi:hypothetical protein AB0J38_11750 [Streptomyces sp. NPDC050095]|uniref:hypothetical protein n=1 Tax=unclassified Streptomyces TaxID=2593676 RepID=UPI003446ABEF